MQSISKTDALSYLALTFKGLDESIFCNSLIVCTNAFTKQLIPELDVIPFRNQVLITKKIQDLKLKGCFHYNKGYVYFRNVGNRILLGGFRNLDI